MHFFEVCMDFFLHSHASSACVLFRCYLAITCALAPYVVLAHVDFIVDCIVLGLLEMHFWSMGELICVLKMLDSGNHLQMKFR